MQTLSTPAPKRFTLGHVVWMALVLTIIVSTLTAVTTLSVTGDLPGLHSNAANVAAETAHATQVAQAQRFYARKEARQAELERQAATTNDSRPTAVQRLDRHSESWIGTIESEAETRARLAEAERRCSKLELPAYVYCMKQVD